MNKNEMFTFWVDSGRNWSETQLYAERIHQEQTEAERGFDSMRGKDIKVKYGADKGQKLINARKTQGWWYEDPDFPGDEDDACLNKTPHPFPYARIGFLP